MPAWFNLAEGYTLLVVASGALALGAVSGLIGSLALVKKQSLLGDAVAHASLPGIVLAFIFVGTRSHSALLIGAALAGWLAALQILFLVKNRRLKQDSSLSLMLAVYFGLGMVLLTMVQQQPGTAQAGIERFLFGEAATMLIGDVKIVAITALAVFLLLMIFWKELLIVAFDPQYAASAGYPVVKLEILFSLLVVATIVAGLQTVGVVLMSSMLVAPAAAARQWTNNIKLMMFLAMIFGGAAGMAGSLLYSMIPDLPTGPTIIIIISLIAFLSFFFGPKRGLVWAYMRKHRRQNAANPESILGMLYLLSEQHEDKGHGHSSVIFQSFYPLKKNLNAVLDGLRTEGLISETESGYWAITDKGIARVAQQRGHTEVQP